MSNYAVHEAIDEIKFNKKYYPLIRDGYKIQTMRLARKNVREGDIVHAVFPGLDEKVKIQIQKIGYKQFKSINLVDAEREGYDSIIDLKNDLLKIYPLINKFDSLYYYIFEKVESNE